MGIYTEYLDQNLNFPDLATERKKYLQRISELRDGRDILVYAAAFNKPRAPVAIGQDDLLPIHDQLSNLKGSKLDLILETPGGSGEVAEEFVRALRSKYDEIGVIVPGWAKSAGTIIAMAGDEILMDSQSALGPIDAQISWQGKVFSAGAFLDGMEKIKREVEETRSLNKAYIPILQGISPGEIQHAQNAQDFSKKLVTDWLAKYKFKKWITHSSTKAPVTEDEKRNRAEEIAGELCNHSKWLTHGRSIKLEDLQAMRLLITDYSKSPDLADAIHRYHILLQMTFDTNIYKVIETPDSQIYRFLIDSQSLQQPRQGPKAAQEANVASVGIRCGKCNTEFMVQANLEKSQPLRDDHVPFPVDNKTKCPNCQNEIDLSELRRNVEAQTKKTIVP